MKDYCLVGTGSRGMSMFAIPLIRDYAKYGRLTGICDANAGRLKWANAQLGVGVQSFTDFDDMLDSVPCDTVIVAVPDALHDHFIRRAMYRGKDVITEKPLTTTAEKCRDILATETETGRRVTVTLNARHTPHMQKIAELLRGGIVGDIHSVDFHWYLDTVHGADYFRRWHRNKEKSGGLLVHKATHHFDLVNWWVGADPKQVVAMGARRFYHTHRQPLHAKRCKDCDVAANCAFYLDVTKAEFRSLYTDHENHDGYFRDQCVYSDDTDIEDTMGVLVRYANGVQMTYSLTAFAPFEGWKIAINGTDGRLEAFEPECAVVEQHQENFYDRVDMRRRVNWEKLQDIDKHTEEIDAYQIRFYPTFGGVETFEVSVEDGVHGGADVRMRDLLFGGFRDGSEITGSHDGAMACLIGIAANISMAERRIVDIEELLGITN